MKRFLFWLVWHVPLGSLAPLVLGLAIGRVPRTAEEGET
jgi:hypothetical protein